MRDEHPTCILVFECLQRMALKLNNYCVGNIHLILSIAHCEHDMYQDCVASFMTKTEAKNRNPCTLIQCFKSDNCFTVNKKKTRICIRELLTGLNEKHKYRFNMNYTYIYRLIINLVLSYF